MAKKIDDVTDLVTPRPVCDCASAGTGSREYSRVFPGPPTGSSVEKIGMLNVKWPYKIHDPHV